MTSGHAQNSPRGLLLKNELRVGGNGRIMKNTAALPGDSADGTAIRFVHNSTGRSLAINLLGTTWTWIGTTTKQPQ